MLKRLKALVAAAAIVIGTVASSATASALPLAPDPIPPVTGIPQPCPAQHEWDAHASLSTIKADIAKNYGIKLVGDGWTKQVNKPIVKIVWETLDAVSCTPYLSTIKTKTRGNIGLNATSISGYAWGDWSLTRANYVSFDFAKMSQALDAGDPGRIVRVIVHELGHAYNVDRYENPAYWVEFNKLVAKHGKFTDYAGSSITETYAEVVGYYVARCAAKNPYDTGKFDEYYAFAKRTVFAGREFAGAAGSKVDCSMKVTKRARPNGVVTVPWATSRLVAPTGAAPTAAPVKG